MGCPINAVLIGYTLTLEVNRIRPISHEEDKAILLTFNCAPVLLPASLRDLRR